MGKLCLESRSLKLILCWYVSVRGYWGKKKKNPFIHEGSKKLKDLMAGCLLSLESLGHFLLIQVSWSQALHDLRKIMNRPTTAQNWFLGYFFLFAITVKGQLISHWIALLHSLLSTIFGRPASLSLLMNAAYLMVYNIKNYTLHVSCGWCRYISLIISLRFTESWQKYWVIEVPF